MQKRALQMTDLIEPAVAAVGYELLGCEFISRGRRSVLRIYIDSPNGINVKDCEKVSHQVSSVLDVEDPIPGKYQLEVSSPGLDRPLFKIAHYEQQIGHWIKVHLRLALNGRRNFVGHLQAVNESQITIACDNDVFDIPFSYIQKGKLIGTKEPTTRQKDE